MRVHLKTWTLVLALAAVACLVLAAFSPAEAAPARARARAAAAGNDEPSMLHWWDRPRFVQLLGVAEEQVKRVREATRDDIAKSAELRKRLREERAELDRLFADEKLDEEAILRQSEKGVQTLGALMKLEALIQLKAAKELTAEQRQELMEIRGLAAEKMREKVRDGRDRPSRDRSEE